MLDNMRKELLKWTERTKEPALAAFKNRSSPRALKEFMAEQDARAGKKQTERKKS